MQEAAALYRARRFSDALKLLSANENEFAGDSQFDYQLGVAALEAGQPAIAQQALERAVLVRPDFPGAWIDLALAHARLGDVGAALQIVEHVEASFSVPLPLHAQLMHLRAELKQPRQSLDINPASLLGARSGYLQLSSGRDTNANLGLASGIFTLTPIGSPPVQIEITPAARAQSDSFVQVRGDLQQILQFGESQKGRIYASGQYKGYGTQTEYSLGDALLQYTHEYAIAGSRGLWLEGVVGARTIAMGGNRLATLQSFGVGLAAYATGCRYGARLTGEVRDYSLNGYVDADIPSVSFSVACRRGIHMFGGILSAASDEPRASRAGGRTDRIELALHYGRQIAPHAEIMVVGILGQYLDAAGYSSLLDNGAARRIERASLRLAWLWEFNPARPEWALHVEMEHLEDRSNLEIFSVRNSRAAVGLRYQF